MKWGWAGEMAQEIKALDTKPDDLVFDPRDSHGRRTALNSKRCPLTYTHTHHATHMYTNTCSCMHTKYVIRTRLKEEERDGHKWRDEEE